MNETRRLLFGSAVMRHGAHIYIYGTLEKLKEPGFGRRLILARVEAGAVGDFSKWRFFGDGSWHADFQKVTPLASGAASEFSVTWVESMKRFVAVGHDAFLSPRIVARTAPEPWGPWSGLTTLYTCPEASRSKGIFCYAGKAHAMWLADDELVISYAANSTQLSEVIRDGQLYWPRFIRVKVELQR